MSLSSYQSQLRNLVMELVGHPESVKIAVKTLAAKERVFVLKVAVEDERVFTQDGRALVHALQHITRYAGFLHDGHWHLVFHETPSPALTSGE